ncbi:laccase 2 [Apiospora arundinis]|uniref:Laccase 2 n=1 Tax=Apiospora arundinis TaxID=335852 RepID=A0ABR2I9Y5_9PEZI
MRFNLPLLLAAVAANAVKAADDAEATADAQATGDAQATDAYRQRCNADNCLRIIRGNQGWPPINKCQTDCSSYLVTTVTPTPPVTTTVTVTITPGPYYGKRDEAADQAADARRPRGVPSYCTNACGNDGWRYRSACSCIGITTYTVYAPTPTITVTATTTANACSGGKTWCGGQCKDCNTDHDNCGKCGNSCKWGEICYKGKCKNHGTCQGAQVCPGWGQQAPSCGGGPRSNCQNGECRMCADGVGRCAPRSATPPNCWQQNRQRCNQNGDCPGGYCVRNCCGSYCYYPDNGDICDLSSSPYKLFRK